MSFYGIMDMQKALQDAWDEAYREAKRRDDENTQKIKTDDAVNWPHKCPRCKGPALELGTSVDCKAKCCKECTWR